MTAIRNTPTLQKSPILASLALLLSIVSACGGLEVAPGPGGTGGNAASGGFAAGGSSGSSATGGAAAGGTGGSQGTGGGNVAGSTGTGGSSGLGGVDGGTTSSGTGGSQGTGGGNVAGSTGTGGSSGLGGVDGGTTSSGTGGSQGTGGDNVAGSTGGVDGGTTSSETGGSEQTDGSAGDTGGGGAAGSQGTGGASGGAAGSSDTEDGGGATDAPVDAYLLDSGADSADASRWSDWQAYLPLASGSAGTTPDVSGHGYNASYGSGVSFSASALVMSGSGDVSIPPQSLVPAVDLTGSYSVSAWVTMTDTSGWRTFVSADGNQVSEFYLQKRQDTGQFAFTLSPSDSNAGALSPCIASSSTTPSSSTRYHLVATRDGTTGLDTLYVNGVVDGTATCLASDGVGWAASTFGIGHGMYGGAKVDYVSGSISGVGLVSRVLTATDVAALYALGGPQ